MSLFKKPSELQINSIIKALIYGEPGIGKSTLALSAPSPVVFDFDGGITRVNSAFQCPALQVADEVDERGNIKKLAWTIVLESMNELRNDGGEFKTIVIDTAGKMLDCLSDYIIKTDNSPKRIMSTADGALSLKGYGKRKELFIEFLKMCSALRKNIIFVAHTKEDKKKKNNEDMIICRPDVGGSSAADLLKELDIVGYAKADGFRRTITWNPCDEFYAKNACNLKPNMEIPCVVDANGVAGNNTFMTEIFNSYSAYLSGQHDVRKKYDELIEKVNSLIDSIDSVEKANSVKDSIVKGDIKKSALWNSELVAKQNLNKKCVALGYKYNQTTGKYEVA